MRRTDVRAPWLAAAALVLIACPGGSDKGPPPPPPPAPAADAAPAAELTPEQEAQIEQAVLLTVALMAEVDRAAGDCKAMAANMEAWFAAHRAEQDALNEKLAAIPDDVRNQAYRRKIAPHKDAFQKFGEGIAGCSEDPDVQRVMKELEK